MEKYLDIMEHKRKSKILSVRGIGADAGAEVQCHSFLMYALHAMNIQLRAAVALPPRKEYQHPLERRLCGSQSRSGCCGEEINFLSLPGIEPQFLRRLVCKLVTRPTALHRFLTWEVAVSTVSK